MFKGTVPINLPAAWSVESIEPCLGAQGTFMLIHVLLPGGVECYTAHVVDPAQLNEETFWLDWLAHVRTWYDSEHKPKAASRTMALLPKPPTIYTGEYNNATRQSLRSFEGVRKADGTFEISNADGRGH